MLERDAQGIWRSTLLAGIDWLEHGFGARFSQDWPPSHAAAARQVHGNQVLQATTAGDCGEGDALVTAVPGLWVGVRTADCVPLLMVDCRLRRVAAVHAGWRGTVSQAKVAPVALQALTGMGGSPADAWVAIGPSIGPCCYEVGPEVAAQFGRTGRVHLNLAAENRDHLVRYGVPVEQIDGLSPPCTRCHTDFHSFRRDGEKAGRMVSAIRLR